MEITKSAINVTTMAYSQVEYILDDAKRRGINALLVTNSQSEYEFWKGKGVACEQWRNVLRDQPAQAQCSVIMMDITPQDFRRWCQAKSGTTKSCAMCGNWKLVLLRSQNKKLCPDCGNEIDWDLAPGQRAIV
ncbi:hypothetical protein [Pseudomonas virus PBPA162]|uniref:Uncharacterized protein n=3 Tax=Viruses TaxID=10239 RepID=A0A7S5E9W4_9CAUD|nr:hypothetical protein PQC31_gp68 [Pseudomonas phage Iggy]YP_010671833.1 hypothetical protein PQC32_gp70 [Pseudomonas virus PBPA162]QDB70904.1 hypothetical protein [Pseudomonas virus PBPA162]QEA09789.1 hypothetical protein [Pseudomonas phage Iggy]